MLRNFGRGQYREHLYLVAVLFSGAKCNFGILPQNASRRDCNDKYIE